MKRYSIVRVDENQCNKCEMYYVNDNGNNDCRLRLGASFLCDRYGDTKEQLIRKVATALQICDKNRVEKCNQFYFVAKEIVEFLGVEE